jgi:hypothetical protein
VTEIEQLDGVILPEAALRSREAASYRRRLRECEAERDELRERVETLERAIAKAEKTARRILPAYDFVRLRNAIAGRRIL